MNRPWNDALGAQPTLTDGVVRLEPYCADAAGLAGMGAWDGDRETQMWFDWPLGWSSARPHRLAAIAAKRAAWEAGEAWGFMLREVCAETVLGWCELQLRGAQAEVSYGTVPAHRGRGVARRGLRLLCAYAFARCPLERIELRCDLENRASLAVAAAAGFRRERCYRAAQPVERYAPLRGQRRLLALFVLCRPDAPAAASASTARATASAPSRKGVA